MTNQEAIRILNLERDEWDISHCTPLERRAAFNMAIEALKSQELKNVPDTNVSNCPYCHEDSDGYVKPIEKNSHAFVRFGMDGWELSLKANGWHGEARIKFCPMCGRGLKHG